MFMPPVTSTSTTSIPTQVAQNYNTAVNAAGTVAGTPFQQYSTDPNAFVAGLNNTQQAGIANTNAAAGQAQPYYQAATGALATGMGQAQPFIYGAANTLGQAQGIGAGLNQAAAYGYAGAPGAADPYNQAAGASYGAGLAAGMPMNAMSAQNVQQAQQQGSMANMAAMGQYGQAQQAVSPYNQAAGASYGSGLAAANPYTYAGGQAVNAQQIGGQQIGQFMSPFLGSAYNAMLAGENMQNAQQASGLQGNAIQAGAFGGDRSGIAQANLAYQQNLANAQTNTNFLNTGYNQALAAAQQQQGVNLAAQQANRAALQTTGQNLYNQYTGTGQALAGLGQNVFGQGTTVAQGVGALGQQQYAQGMGAAAQQAALGNQAYNQYTGTGQALAGLGQNVYGQQTGAAQGLAGVGNQAFTQGATTAAQQAALGNQLYGMGTGASQQLAALGTGAQGAALQGAQAQMGAGQVAQQTQQAGLTALYNQFLQQQAYPFQTSQFYTNAVGSLGPLYGATTTSTTPTSFLSGVARGGAIKPKYASGGLIPSSMGGAVGIEHAGEGFAYGGTPDVMSAIQAIYNPTGTASSGLAPSSAAWGDIFNTLGSQTAAKPSASQMLSDYSLLNPAALRAPPATSSSGTTTSSAPTTTSSIPYMSATSTGLGAGELGGMGGPGGPSPNAQATGSLLGDVLGMKAALGDIFSGGTGWGSPASNALGLSTNAVSEVVQNLSDPSPTAPGSNENARNAGSGFGGGNGSGNQENNEAEKHSGGRVGKYYGGAASGLGLSPQQIADIQAMMQANSGLLPGMPAGYKPMTSMNAQPGQGLAGINMQAHPSQFMRGPSIQQPNNTSVVGGLTHGVNDLKALQNDYNFFAGDNSNTQSNNSSPGLLSSIGSALGFASGGLAGRGHYANAGSVYTSAGQEAAIPDYSSDIDLGIPDVPFNPPQIQQPQTSSKGSSGGGLGGLLKDLAGIGSLLGNVLKDGGSVDGRRGYAGGGGSGNGAGGDTDIQSIVDEESIRLGLPISLGRALIGQESSYNQNLTGGAGELGASQILPSTAKSPGYGMQGVDPSTLAGPGNARNNINFGLSYLKARGEHAGVNDWTDTSQIPKALMAYNGGGDPNYVQHVMSRMNGGNGNVVGGGDGGGGGGDNTTTGLAAGSPPAQPQSSGLAPSNLGPYEQLQNQPLNWFQRNQDVLGGVAGAIGGMRGARNPIAAILGAVGGGASGYNAGQQALASQAAKEAETAAIPQRVNVQQQQVNVESGRNAIEAMKYFTANMRKYVDPTTGQIMWRDDVAGTPPMTDAEHSARMQSLGSAVMGSMPLTPGMRTAIGQPGAQPQTQVGKLPPQTPQAGAPQHQQTAPATPKPPASYNGQPSPASTTATPEGSIDDSMLNEMDSPTALSKKIANWDAAITSGEANGIDMQHIVTQRDDAVRRKDGIISGTIIPNDINGNPFVGYKDAANQRAQNASLSEAIGKNKNEYYTSANNYLNSFPENQNLINAMTTAYQGVNTNRATPQIAQAIGYLRSIPGINKILPQGLEDVQGAYDVTQKLAITDAFKAIATNQAQAAPRTALVEALQTVASPTMAPEAKYDILTRNLGEMDRQKAMYEDWFNQGKPDPAEFAIKWNKDPAHNITNYIDSAKARTPKFAGMSNPPGSAGNPNLIPAPTQSGGGSSPTLQQLLDEQKNRQFRQQ